MNKPYSGTYLRSVDVYWTTIEDKDGYKYLSTYEMGINAPAEWRLHETISVPVRHRLVNTSPYYTNQNFITNSINEGMMKFAESTLFPSYPQTPIYVRHFLDGQLRNGHSIMYSS